MNKYIGHQNQISGVEEVTLSRGKGKGMTLLEIRNGQGLFVTLSADRCMDIARISFLGNNMGYFAPCGYVAPAYYDKDGSGFLKSFTAGFLTTCGLSAVGSPCEDNGETLPLHGNIANTPCESWCCDETDAEITVTAKIRDAAIFGNCYLLTRTYRISKTENKIELSDRVENTGNTLAPCMLLYHTNFGYPLLSENARVFIPSGGVKSRDEHAKELIDTRLLMEKPQAGYQECCYYYDVISEDGVACVGIFNQDIGKGVKLSYDKKTLPFFTEWKMMGEGEYVLGLEPGNCTPDGRDVMRKNGTLTELKKGESYTTRLTYSFTQNIEDMPL